MLEKKVLDGTKWLSTTEAAKLCGLCHMTIIRHFDAGDIKGFKVPGSRFRRIPRKSLLDFARRHGIPLPELSEKTTADAPAEESCRGRGWRALVVEDNRDMAELLEKVLVTDGWEVRVARNGFDAGLQAASFLPQLVLLDIMLPWLDGRQACRQMKANPQLAGTKILAVTALKDEKSVQEIMEAGVDGYLAKPFGLKVLRTRIAELVGEVPARSRAESGVLPPSTVGDLSLNGGPVEPPTPNHHKQCRSVVTTTPA